jgi:phage repressor protein C with HTH and peptisase S24 domain
MFRHGDIWRAIDRMAAQNGLSTSGLAKAAGLDPTSFNKSKRIGRDGKPRWPGTESIAKVLEAVDATLGDFSALMEGGGGRRIPVIGLARAGGGGYFDDAGFPTGAGWEEIVCPDIDDPDAYGLEITGDSMEPVFRAGAIVIVSPGSGIRRGDRVVVKTRDGEVMAKELVRRTARRIELKSVNRARRDPVLAANDVAWLARILWVSQ